MRYPTILGLAATVMLVQVQPVLAKTKTGAEVGQVAKPITVMITTPDEIGSGVIIKREGNVYSILTAAHVVKSNSAAYTIMTTDGENHELDNKTIQPLPKKIDLAIIKFTSSKTYPVAKIGNSSQVVEGSNVYAAGFPAPTQAITQAVYAFKDGKVIANSAKEFENGYGIVYSCNTLPGMSGGGVFNENGELVAIHGRGDIDGKFKPSQENENIRFKTGNDLGVPIDTFVRLASNVGVNTGLEPLPAIAKTDPPKAADFFISAVAKEKKGDYTGTLTDLNRALEIDPKFADGYYGRGVANEKLGEQQKAMADYDRAIELNPNLPSAYNNRGLLRFNLGDNKGAIADYDRSIENNPNAPNVFNNRGLARFKLGNKEAAIGDYDLAINIQPDYAEAYNNRGMALAALKDWPRAKTDYDRAIKFNPKLAEPYNNRGTARLSMQDWQGAISDFDRAIQINPKLAISYASRGLIKFIKLGDKPAAIADLQTAKTLFEQQGNKKLYKVTSDQLNKIQSSNSQSSAS
jgi:tetratricopeptide (TPR) repeat protein